MFYHQQVYALFLLLRPLAFLIASGFQRLNGIYNLGIKIILATIQYSKASQHINSIFSLVMKTVGFTYRVTRQTTRLVAVFPLVMTLVIPKRK